MKLSTYLNFHGDCEAALNFYSACGLGEVTNVMRFANSPMAEQAGPARAQQIMHATLVGPDVHLHGSDTLDAEPMKGCALILEGGDVDAAGALFKALSAGGATTQPLEKMFWGDFFGSFTDRFGVRWLMNCHPES